MCGLSRTHEQGSRAAGGRIARAERQRSTDTSCTGIRRLYIDITTGGGCALPREQRDPASRMASACASGEEQVTAHTARRESARSTSDTDGAASLRRGGCQASCQDNVPAIHGSGSITDLHGDRATCTTLAFAALNADSTTSSSQGVRARPRQE